ncbi:MAG: hypothetical protein WD426_08450 [Anditalea sp.]
MGVPPKQKREDVGMALQPNGRKDDLFALRQELGTYDYLQNKLEECDAGIRKVTCIRTKKRKTGLVKRIKKQIDKFRWTNLNPG